MGDLTLLTLNPDPLFCQPHAIFHLTRPIPMQIVVDVPANLPDALQQTQREFADDAKMAMAAKLYEMKRLSSGMAATLAGVDRVRFLSDLHRYGVAIIDLDDDELSSDILNA
jgi:predicted HTH domain antitoxin